MSAIITISLWQPWASAMAAALKRIETRGWATELTPGTRIAIQAAKRDTGEQKEFWIRRVKARPECVAAFEKIGIRDWCDMPLGKIVCTLDYLGCQTTEHLVESGKVRAESGEFFWGNFATTDDQSGRPRFGWLTDNVTPLAVPVPVKGWQNFFTWDPVTNVTVGMPPARRGKLEETRR